MDSKATVAELRALVGEFVRERDWERYHNPKDLSIALSVEAAELLELFLWEDNIAGRLGGPVEKRAREELADIVIYCLSFANAQGWDVSDLVRAKVSRNARKYPASKYRGVAKLP